VSAYHHFQGHSLVVCPTGVGSVQSQDPHRQSDCSTVVRAFPSIESPIKLHEVHAHVR
jgi:hypothetical protein